MKELEENDQDCSFDLLGLSRLVVFMDLSSRGRERWIYMTFMIILRLSSNWRELLTIKLSLEIYAKELDKGGEKSKAINELKKITIKCDFLFLSPNVEYFVHNDEYNSRSAYEWRRSLFKGNQQYSFRVFDCRPGSTRPDDTRRNR